MGAIAMELLAEIHFGLRDLPHGGKSDYVAEWAQRLGVSAGTIYRRLAAFGAGGDRRRRADAGDIVVSEADARVVSTILMESMRRNNKRLMSVAQAMQVALANGKIAPRVDAETGETQAVAPSTMARALRQYCLHPDQLLQPAPVTELASLHPNHVWAGDASLCVLYYLRREADTYAGLQVMPHAEFYKNKPRNVERIANDRVWRYVFSDHASGAYYLEYVLGAESGINLTDCFINAIQPENGGVMHGVPWIVMLDPGSANTSAMFKNLTRALGIELIINSVGNARGKGQVEKTHDIVERQFESGLKFTAVHSLDELNAHARRFMRVHNAQAIHSRTGKSRYAVWMTITPEQLRLGPGVEHCRELATSAAETRKVRSTLTISVGGVEYDVSTVPGLIVGDEVTVVKNAWRPETVQIVRAGLDGREVHHVVEPIVRNELGFREGAPIIGERYARHADTPAQSNAKAVELLAMNVPTQAEAEAKRRGRALAFDGQLDPYKPVTDAVLPTYLPRRGTELNVPSPAQIESRPYSLIEAGRWAVSRLGRPLTLDENAAMRSRWPDGVPETELDTLLDSLRGEEAAPVAAAGGLRLV